MKYSCRRRSMKKDDLVLSSHGQVFLLCPFVPLVRWRMSGISASEKGTSHAHCSPWGAAGGQDTQWQERWLCPCCEPSSWGITPSHPAATFSLGKPHFPYPWDRSNSGMELKCNSGIKSFTHSWFLPQPGLHYCPDIFFGLFPFHHFPDSVFSLFWRTNA